MNWELWIRLAGADQVPGHEAKDEHLLQAAKHRTSSYLLVDQVNGTSNIDVYKVHFNCLVQELCTFGHRVWKCSLQLPKRGQVS